jgi:hypothetical protein
LRELAEQVIDEICAGDFDAKFGGGFLTISEVFSLVFDAKTGRMVAGEDFWAVIFECPTSGGSGAEEFAGCGEIESCFVGESERFAEPEKRGTDRDLVGHFHHLALSGWADVGDAATVRFEDRFDIVERFRGSATEDGECSVLGTHRSTGNGGIDKINLVRFASFGNGLRTVWGDCAVIDDDGAGFAGWEELVDDLGYVFGAAEAETDNGAGLGDLFDRACEFRAFTQGESIFAGSSVPDEN